MSAATLRVIVASERTETGPPARSGPKPGDDEDATLLRRMAGQDVVAFQALVERHLAAVVGMARRMLRDEAEAEDVAQETMLRLWRSGSGLEIGPGGLRPWLRRVAANLCIDRTRSGRRTDIVEEVPEQPVQAEQVRALEAQDLQGRVGQALAGLPERQRHSLTLFHYEGMSMLEIGSLMGISEEAVESLLARARRTLKAALADDWRGLLPDAEI